MKYTPIASLLVIWLFSNDGITDNGFIVSNNQYVLIERQISHDHKTEYAGFKFIQQDEKIDGLIKYEWISLDYGDRLVQIETQNFKYGETTGVGKFGIGFQGYRFFWEPNDNKTGKIHCAFSVNAS